ncbi:MAG: hypothetical protein JWN09_1145 [Microbacteriaceae bacterium]|nr:hypothetical protein [Microbacteriaceae bacterium]
MTAWLGVVSRSHVLRGVGLGIAQVNHGKQPPLARMHAGDALVYYSPRTDYPDGEPLQAFTAVGRIADDELWQADEGSFRPWRRRVDWDAAAHEVPIRPLIGRLEFTVGQNWGYLLHRGLLTISDADLDIIRTEMTTAA